MADALRARTGPALGMRAILTALFRRKWSMLGVFAGVGATLALFTYVLPEVYRSEAKILVKLGREALVVDPAVSIGGPRTGSAATTLTNKIHTQLDILTSRILAEKTVDAIGADRFLAHPQETPAAGAAEELRGVRRALTDLGEAKEQAMTRLDLATPLSRRERAIAGVIERLEARVPQESSVIDVSFEAESPELAHDTLDTLIGFFLEQTVKVNAFEVSPEFFEAQCAAAKTALDERQRELSGFRRANGLAEDASAQQENLHTQIAELKTAIGQAASETEYTKARIEALREALATRTRETVLSRTTGEANPALEAMKQRRLEAGQRVAELEALYPEDNRLLVAARGQLAALDTAIAGERGAREVVTRGIDATYDSLRLELDQNAAQQRSAEARLAMLREELGQREGEFQTLIAQAATLAALQREADLLKTEYLDYRETLHRAKVNAALDRDKISSVSVVQPATRPVTPVRPNKLFNLMMALLIAAAAAAGTVFALELLDDTLESGDDAERYLGLPAVGTVSLREFRTCT